MSHCAVTLAPASEMLLGIVLALAADEWPQVAEPCRAFLGGGWAGSTDADGPSQRHLLAGLISKLILGLADAAKGNQDALILHARRLSTALQVPTASLTGPSSSLAKDLSIADIPAFPCLNQPRMGLLSAIRTLGASAAVLTGMP